MVKDVMATRTTENGNVGQVVSMAFKALQPKIQENVERALGYLHDVAQNAEKMPLLNGLVVRISLDEGAREERYSEPSVRPDNAYEFFQGASDIWKQDPALQSKYPKANRGMDLLEGLHEQGRVSYTRK